MTLAMRTLVFDLRHCVYVALRRLADRIAPRSAAIRRQLTNEGPIDHNTEADQHERKEQS